MKKEMKMFLSIAFLIPYLCAIPMYFAKVNGMGVDVFPILFMLAPALATIIVLQTTRPKEELPNKFFVSYEIVFAIVLVSVLAVSLFKVCNEEASMLIVTGIVLIGSIVNWIMFFIEKKEKRERFGLLPFKFKQLQWYYFLLVLIEFGYTYITAFITHDLGGLTINAKTVFVYVVLFISFFTQSIMFFGEEYGWRFFLQPYMQEKYGMQKGILYVGILWGVWHLPLNLMYYSAGGTWFYSLLGQIVFCIGFAYFLGYVYNKTKSIWVVSYLHMVHNSMYFLMTGNFDVNALKDNVFTIETVLVVFGLSIVFYLLFGRKKEMLDASYRMPTVEER